MSKLSVRRLLTCLSVAVAGLFVISGVGCSSGTSSSGDETGDQALKESAELAAPPGMGDALQQMYEGGEVDAETAEKLFQSGAMMPQGYPMQKSGQTK